MSNYYDWHVYPVNDAIEHERTGEGCVCIPDAKLHGDAWIMVHHSLDGRELTEGAAGR